MNHLWLGNIPYDKEQLLAILDEPVAGNGLVALCHQLIATKLNIENGVAFECIADTVAESDGMIGDLICPPHGDGCLPPDQVSALVAMLTSYNQGELCAPHCAQEQGPPFSIERVSGSCP